MNTSYEQCVYFLTHTMWNHIRRGIYCLYGVFLKPRSTNEDDKRKERIITLVLFAISILLILYEISLIKTVIAETYRETASIINLVHYSVLTLLFIGMYGIARKGYWHLVAYSTVILYFLATVYGSYQWGASMPIGLLSYGMIIVIASITISPRFGIVIALASCASITITGIREVSHESIATWKQSALSIHNIVEYGIMLCFTAVLSWLSHREIEHSLVRARNSESALKQERDNLEITVQERTRALQQAEHENMIQLRRFAEFGKISAGAFHDLLNPLSVVALTVDGLHKEHSTEQADTAKQAVSIAIRATQKMQHYIESLRQTLRASTHQQEFSVHNEIVSVIEVVRFYATRNNVTISYVPNETLPPLYGSQLTFNQIISNVIINAIEAFPELTTANSTNERIVTITTTEHIKETTEKVLSITIADNGTGMTPETASQIFTNFFTTKTHGVGLGLSNTKDNIENAFTGAIHCQSTFGEGTVFTLTFPLPH